MKTIAVLLSLMMTAPAVATETCAFEGQSLYELRNHSQFIVSDEAPTPISRDLFWANYFFFKDFTRYGCRGAYRTASVVDPATQRTYRYYRTNEDSCDGGNTNGIFIEESVSIKAIAVMNDGDINCR